MTTIPSSSKKRKADDLGIETPAIPPNEGVRERITCANLALDYYNKRNHTSYELVKDKAPASNKFTHHGQFCVHCSFYAKDSSVHLFFAEICMISPLELDITCVILTGQGYISCKYCRTVIMHPLCGYQLGGPNYSCHASLSISGHNGDPWKGPKLDMEIVKKDEDSGNKTTDCPRNTASPWYRQAYKESTRNNNIEKANLALGYYNNKNKTNFKLVEHDAMEINFFLDDRLPYAHCLFNATDSSVKQFFAEIIIVDPLRPVVRTCEILEGKCYVGCECCCLFIHPDGEYFSEDDPDKEFVEKDKDYAHEAPDHEPYSALYKPFYPVLPAGPPASPNRCLVFVGDSMSHMYDLPGSPDTPENEPSPRYQPDSPTTIYVNPERVDDAATRLDI